MESTFLSVVLSNYTVGIVILVVFSLCLLATMYLAYHIYIWLLMPIGGLFLLDIYMLIIWVNPGYNTSNSVIPVNLIGIVGFICLIFGTIICVVLNQIRLQFEVDKANELANDIEEKRRKALGVLGNRNSENKDNR